MRSRGSESSTCFGMYHMTYKRRVRGVYPHSPDLASSRIIMAGDSGGKVDTYGSSVSPDI